MRNLYFKVIVLTGMFLFSKQALAIDFDGSSDNDSCKTVSPNSTLACVCIRELEKNRDTWELREEKDGFGQTYVIPGNYVKTPGTMSSFTYTNPTIESEYVLKIIIDAELRRTKLIQDYDFEMKGKILHKNAYRIRVSLKQDANSISWSNSYSYDELHQLLNSYTVQLRKLRECFLK